MTTVTSSRGYTLGNQVDWEIFVSDFRVLVRQKTRRLGKTTVLSSAVLHGGLKIFTAKDPPLQILNAKVPEDYDGVHPSPTDLLRQLADVELSDGCDRVTVGLLTAASFETCCLATREATGQSCLQTVIVDAIVTAGISNARAAGADADVFSFVVEEEPPRNATEPVATTGGDPKPFGTINCIVLTNATLDETCLVEAYAIAIEAKCKAAADAGIVCAKNPSDTATGTGTDSIVLVCQQVDTGGIPYAGKHTLLGELVGQAVYQATREAIELSFNYQFAGYPLLSPSTCYQLHCYKLQFLRAVREGHRPLVPSQPMKPIPAPRAWVLLVGLLGVMVAFGLHIFTVQAVGTCPSWTYLPRPSVSVLLAVVWADRFLGSVMMPLSIHPVVLVGKLITVLLSHIPESAFQPDQHLRGFLSGLLLFLTTVLVSVAAAGGLLLLPNLLSWRQHVPANPDLDTCVHWDFLASSSGGFHLVSWSLQVFLVRGSLSLQLLCNVALQMAHFLERNQIGKARDQLSWLCSRDPADLRSDELAGATLESLSENLSDSVVSPLVFYVLLGPLGAIGFRVTNTLDSRVGYRGRNEWVGKPSARWDDGMNLIPARLTALLLVLSAAFLDAVGGGASDPALVVQQGLSVAWRDAWQCDSPNAGWPMATLAGILDVCLEKRGQYSLNGPKRGGTGRLPNHHDIRKGHTIVEVAGIMAFLLAMAAVGFGNIIG